MSENKIVKKTRKKPEETKKKYVLVKKFLDAHGFKVDLYKAGNKYFVKINGGDYKEIETTIYEELINKGDNYNRLESLV